MVYTFYKYQGTGNDFIIIDNRQNFFNKNNTKLVAQLCDRRFGIGADGLILLEHHSTVDFKMIYYNSDGNESTMCGNGGRCISAFSKFLGLVNTSGTFEAIDGLHDFKIYNKLVKLKMQNVDGLNCFDNYTYLDTGSPHYVMLNNEVEKLDIKEEGAKIRYSKPFAKEGVNVNFVEKVNESTFKVRTYERGVEDETLSCGTGVTAVAIAMHKTGETNNNLITLQTIGGELQIEFSKNNSGYNNIWLIGPAKQVFKGEVTW